jgi:hypothetical protein
LGRGEAMTLVRGMRERTITPPPIRSGIAGMIVLAVVAFAVGAGGILAWKRFAGSSPLPVASASPPAAASNKAPAPKFAGNRLGRAGTAPLLRTCVKGETFETFINLNAQAIYTVMTTASTMMRTGPLVGAPTGDPTQLADQWREIADCVYQQNSWHLCDADNRALAVESASGFLRFAAQIPANPMTMRDEQTLLRDVAQTRQRVLEALRTRLRNGHIIASDFGPLQPTEIKALLADTKTVGNGCAK